MVTRARIASLRELVALVVLLYWQQRHRCRRLWPYNHFFFFFVEREKSSKYYCVFNAAYFCCCCVVRALRSWISKWNDRTMDHQFSLPRCFCACMFNIPCSCAVNACVCVRVCFLSWWNFSILSNWNSIVLEIFSAHYIFLFSHS